MRSRRGGALLIIFFTPLAGCHGDLFDLSPDAGGGDDAATSSGVFFAPAIQHDLDAQSCAAAGPCHGGGAPMHLTADPPDAPALAANYAEVKPRASADSASLLLQKTLQGGATHAGTQPFASTSDPTYQRWLGWIRAGAPFAPDGGI